MNWDRIVDARLPRGLWRDGTHLCRVDIRPATGADQEVLIEAADQAPAVRASLLLGRCLIRLEGEMVDAPSMARQLSIGDRDALLLHLRRISIGNVMDCVLTCPTKGCGQELDIPLALEGLLLPPLDGAKPTHETVIPNKGGHWTVRFRVPTGDDQEAAVRVARAGGLDAARRHIAERCIEHVEPTLDSGERLPEPLITGLSAAIAAVEPQADLGLQFACPECEASIRTRLDVASCVLAELTPDRQALSRHVHLLALHYHWSERDILALTPHRRRVYLDLLSDATAEVLERGTAA